MSKRLGFKVSCRECGSNNVDMDVFCGQNVGIINFKCEDCERESTLEEGGWVKNE